jgi:pimeloyl-ACP methyl ester carboxylesterase
VRSPAELQIDLEARGIRLAVYDWGGDRPAVLCAHATGFCGRMWELVAAELAGDFRVVAFDARGHGASTVPPPPGAYAWGELAADIVALAEVLAAEHGIDQVAVGAGNSLGGTTMLAAAAARPDLFAAVALVDPVVLERAWYADPAAAGGGRLAAAAARRRSAFPSRAAVVEAYRGRELFADWDPRALALYAEHGFRDTAEGSVELRCPPVVESAVFAASRTLDPFAAAARLSVPGEVMVARDSFPPEPFHELCALAPSLRLAHVDCGHLMPMIDPRLVAERIRAVHSA